MSHTPGPWTVFSDYPTLAIGKTANEPLARVFPPLVGGRAALCNNAVLIAAAPDLLEFAQQVAQVAKNHGNRFIEVWALSVCQQAGFAVTLKDEVAA